MVSWLDSGDFLFLGFTEDWAEQVDKISKSRLTRHTPHKARPVTPIEEMIACDQKAIDGK